MERYTKVLNQLMCSDEFIKSTMGYIKGKFGEDYIGSVKQSKKTENVQDAHEAIRPTSIMRHPDLISKYLSSDQIKLYKLIWQRFLASMMAPAEYNVMTVEIMAAKCKFRATGSTVKFDGFTN